MDDDDDAPDVDAPDDLSALFTWLADRLDPGDMATAEQLVENILTALSMASDRRRIATNAYTGVNTVINRDTIRELQAIRTAEMEVQPFVGAVLGMDSAFAVYSAALKRLGRDAAGLQGSAAAARSVFNMSKSQPRRTAMDSKATSRLEEMFPNWNRLKSR